MCCFYEIRHQNIKLVEKSRKLCGFWVKIKKNKLFYFKLIIISFKLKDILLKS